MHSDRKNRRARLQTEKTKLVGFAGEVHKRNEVDRCHHPFRRGILSSIVVKATGSLFLLSIFFSRTIGLRVYLRQDRPVNYSELYGVHVDPAVKRLDRGVMLSFHKKHKWLNGIIQLILKR